jgi:hypothetical protein
VIGQVDKFGRVATETAPLIAVAEFQIIKVFDPAEGGIEQWHKLESLRIIGNILAEKRGTYRHEQYNKINFFHSQRNRVTIPL